MSSRIPEPESPLEAEGIPDLSDALPQKAATGDAQEEMPPPRDYPVAAEDYGTTAAEERAGEPLELRVSREEPDTIADPAANEHVGRLVAEREGGTNKDQDSVASDMGTDDGGYSAEEQAMHEEPPPE